MRLGSSTLFWFYLIGYDHTDFCLVLLSFSEFCLVLSSLSVLPE